MERLKLPPESRRLLVRAGVRFESWLVEIVAESGTPLEEVSPLQIERVLANLNIRHIQEFLLFLNDNDQNDIGEQQAA